MPSVGTNDKTDMLDVEVSEDIIPVSQRKYRGRAEAL